MTEIAKVKKIPRCDLCGDQALYDAKTRRGPWANLCRVCFIVEGCWLGLGKGQMLELEE